MMWVIEAYWPPVRIVDALEGENEVAGGDRHAVRPVGVGAQLERPHHPVVRGGPAFGDARDGLALGVFGGQTDDHVADDVVLPAAGGFLGIEGVGFGAVAAFQDHRIGREGQSGGGEGRKGGKQDLEDFHLVAASPCR